MAYSHANATYSHPSYLLLYRIIDVFFEGLLIDASFKNWCLQVVSMHGNKKPYLEGSKYHHDNRYLWYIPHTICHDMWEARVFTQIYPVCDAISTCTLLSIHMQHVCAYTQTPMVVICQWRKPYRMIHTHAVCTTAVVCAYAHSCHHPWSVYADSTHHRMWYAFVNGRWQRYARCILMEYDIVVHTVYVRCFSACASCGKLHVCLLREKRERESSWRGLLLRFEQTEASRDQPHNQVCASTERQTQRSISQFA